eukprot:2993997-Prymnesium_polylepis.2
MKQPTTAREPTASGALASHERRAASRRAAPWWLVGMPSSTTTCRSKTDAWLAHRSSRVSVGPIPSTPRTSRARSAVARGSRADRSAASAKL